MYLFFCLYTDDDVLQTRGLQEITNQNFDEAVKEVEDKFVLVSDCFTKMSSLICYIKMRTRHTSQLLH